MMKKLHTRKPGRIKRKPRRVMRENALSETDPIPVHVDADIPQPTTVPNVANSASFEPRPWPEAPKMRHESNDTDTRLREDEKIDTTTGPSNFPNVAVLGALLFIAGLIVVSCMATRSDIADSTNATTQAIDAAKNEILHQPELIRGGQRR